MCLHVRNDLQQVTDYVPCYEYLHGDVVYDTTEGLLSVIVTYFAKERLDSELILQLLCNDNLVTPCVGSAQH
jgi:hypothetical protein